MEFVLRSFFQTVDHKAPIRFQKATSDLVVQSQLLECKFFTWPFFLSYVAKAHDALIQLRGRAWKDAGVAVPGTNYFDGLWPFKFTTIKYLSFAEGFRIPEKLLHGPWTEDKAALLYVLVSLSGEIDWHGSLAGETAKEGLKDAVMEKNERVVAALSVLLGVSANITTDMLQHAVIEGGCDLNIIRHLLFNAQILYADTPKEILDFHDAALWAWADSVEGTKAGKGELLKDMLKRAEKFDLEFYNEGEANWQKIVPFPYSGEKYDSRAGFDIIGRELLSRLYRNHGRRITRRRQRSQIYGEANEDDGERQAEA
jgi:large subunit ribosomal protein L14e